MGSIVRDSAWALKLKRAQEYLTITTDYFPQYVREIEGYAEGAEVDFLELWTLSLEDEFSYYRDEHCTSVITNGGKLISHNEDWASDAADQICVLQKTVGDLTTLELNYWSSLGGNSASINSHGYIQLINTLTHTDWQMGVPRNVIARFMSETRDPVKDFEKLRAIRRATGYNHNIIDFNGNIWNIEATSRQCMLLQPEIPFVHTNHYLSEQLKPYEAETGQTTFKRYEVATRRVKPHMSKQELFALTSDDSQGPDLSIFNERTIARIIIDLERKIASIWLIRESERGWVEYPLPGM
jgi:predicted choloylglycine hydrolase